MPDHMQLLAIAAVAFWCAVRWGGPLFLLASLHQIWIGEFGIATMLLCLAAFFDTIRTISVWSDQITPKRRQARLRH